MSARTFSKESLRIDCAEQVRLISREIQRLLASFRRRGLIVGLSGGIDSSVTAALCVQAVGRERVFGLHMPDRHSAEDTLALSRSVASHFGFDSAEEEITGMLEAAGCYSRQEEAIRGVIPEYGAGWKSKLVLENILANQGFNYFNLVVQAPDGTRLKRRLPLEAYLGIVAATNFKQRVRKMMEYYYADRLNYAVAGTPNRLEYDQGFFVKLGDGAADLKPIAHLYKTQVYQLAECQEEFFFSLPHDQLDLCLYAKNHALPAATAAAVVGLTPEQVERVYQDIDTKRAATRYLHLKPQLVAPVPELQV
jgi:NAD+ synthase